MRLAEPGTCRGMTTTPGEPVENPQTDEGSEVPPGADPDPQEQPTPNPEPGEDGSQPGPHNTR
jgi:hypothetical protein